MDQNQHEEQFCFKVVVHNVIVNPDLFMQLGSSAIYKPSFAFQFLDFPYLSIDSKGPLATNSVDNQHIFGIGKQSLFSYDVNELFQEFKTRPLISLLIDQNSEQTLGKCLITLETFIQEIKEQINGAMIYSNSGLKREMFSYFNDQKIIIAQADISMGICLQRSKNVVQQPSDQFYKSNQQLQQAQQSQIQQPVFSKPKMVPSSSMQNNQQNAVNADINQKIKVLDDYQQPLMEQDVPQQIQQQQPQNKDAATILPSASSQQYMYSNSSDTKISSPFQTQTAVVDLHSARLSQPKLPVMNVVSEENQMAKLREQYNIRQFEQVPINYVSQQAQQYNQNQQTYNQNIQFQQISANEQYIDNENVKIQKKQDNIQENSYKPPTIKTISQDFYCPPPLFYTTPANQAKSQVIKEDEEIIISKQEEPLNKQAPQQNNQITRNFNKTTKLPHQQTKTTKLKSVNNNARQFQETQQIPKQSKFEPTLNQTCQNLLIDNFAKERQGTVIDELITELILLRNNRNDGGQTQKRLQTMGLGVFERALLGQSPSQNQNIQNQGEGDLQLQQNVPQQQQLKNLQQSQQQALLPKSQLSKESEYTTQNNKQSDMGASNYSQDMFESISVSTSQVPNNNNNKSLSQLSDNRNFNVPKLEGARSPMFSQGPRKLQSPMRKLESNNNNTTSNLNALNNQNSNYPFNVSASVNMSNSGITKVAQCFMCNERFDSSKAQEHIKSCKKIGQSLLKSSQGTKLSKSSLKEITNSSMLSIDEEDEQEIKEYSRANVKSTPHESKSDNIQNSQYSEDFDAFSESDSKIY